MLGGTCVCVYVREYVCVPGCVYVSGVHVCMLGSICMCGCVSGSTRVCVPGCVYVSGYMCMHTRVCLCVGGTCVCVREYMCKCARVCLCVRGTCVCGCVSVELV